MFSGDNAGIITVWKTVVNNSKQPCHCWCIEKVQDNSFVVFTVYYLLQFDLSLPEVLSNACLSINGSKSVDPHVQK